MKARYSVNMVFHSCYVHYRHFTKLILVKVPPYDMLQFQVGTGELKPEMPCPALPAETSLSSAAPVPRGTMSSSDPWYSQRSVENCHDGQVPWGSCLYHHVLEGRDVRIAKFADTPWVSIARPGCWFTLYMIRMLTLDSLHQTPYRYRRLIPALSLTMVYPLHDRSRYLSGNWPRRLSLGTRKRNQRGIWLLFSLMN